MAILSFDIGEKRTGVAISESKFIAQPLFSLKHSSEKELLLEIKKLIGKYKPDIIVIGLPISFSRKTNFQQEKIKNITGKISQFSTAKIEFIDETLTTKIAQSKFQNTKAKYDIDIESAVEILESYLEKLKS